MTQNSKKGGTTKKKGTSSAPAPTPDPKPTTTTIPTPPEQQLPPKGANQTTETPSNGQNNSSFSLLESRNLASKLSTTAHTLHNRFLDLNGQLHTLTTSLSSIPATTYVATTASLPTSPGHSSLAYSHPSSQFGHSLTSATQSAPTIYNPKSLTSDPQSQLVQLCLSCKRPNTQDTSGQADRGALPALHQSGSSHSNLARFIETSDSDLLDDIDPKKISASISRNPELFDPRKMQAPELGSDGRLVKIDESTAEGINQLKKDVELLLSTIQQKTQQQMTTNGPTVSRQPLHDLLHMMAIMYTVPDEVYIQHYEGICRYFHDFLFHPNSSRMKSLVQSHVSTPTHAQTAPSNRNKGNSQGNPFQATPGHGQSGVSSGSFFDVPKNQSTPGFPGSHSKSKRGDQKHGGSRNTTPRNTPSSTPTHSLGRAADDSNALPIKSNMNRALGAGVINHVVRSNRRTAQGDSEMEAMFDGTGHYKVRKHRSGTMDSGQHSTHSRQSHSKYESDGDSDIFGSSDGEDTDLMFQQIEKGDFPTPQPRPYIVDENTRDAFLQRNIIDRKAPGEAGPMLITPNASFNNHKVKQSGLGGKESALGSKEGYIVELIPSAKHRIVHIQDENLEKGVGNVLNTSQVWVDDIDNLSEDGGEKDKNDKNDKNDKTLTADPDDYVELQLPPKKVLHAAADRFHPSPEESLEEDDYDGEEGSCSWGGCDDDNDGFGTLSDDGTHKPRPSTVVATPHNVPPGIEFKNGRWVRTSPADEESDPFSSGDEGALDNIPDFDTPEYHATKKTNKLPSNIMRPISGYDSDDERDTDSTISTPVDIKCVIPPPKASPLIRKPSVISPPGGRLRSLPTLDANTMQKILQEEEERLKAVAAAAAVEAAAAARVPESGTARRGSIPSATDTAPLPGLIKHTGSVIVDHGAAYDDYEGIHIGDGDLKPVNRIQEEADFEFMSLSSGVGSTGKGKSHTNSHSQAKGGSREAETCANDLDGLDDQDGDNSNLFVIGADGKKHLKNPNNQSMHSTTSGSNSSFTTMNLSPEEVAQMMASKNQNKNFEHSTVIGIVGGDDYVDPFTSDDEDIVKPVAKNPPTQATQTTQATPTSHSNNNRPKPGSSLPMHPTINGKGMTTHKPRGHSMKTSGLKSPGHGAIDISEWDDEAEEKANEEAIRKIKSKPAGNPKVVPANAIADKNIDSKKELHELELPTELQHTLFMTEQFHFGSFGAPLNPALSTTGQSSQEGTPRQSRRGRSPNTLATGHHD